MASPNCENFTDLDYLDHLNTAANARDLDLIRNLTGFEELDYYGIDYGSVLGTAYAALFPENVGRMVLDGTQTTRTY
jgi:pimeloyl-ACP methyl ester carboxylesterase